MPGPGEQPRELNGRFGAKPPRTPGTATAAEILAQQFVETPVDNARFDSWSNALTGIGTHAYDKRESSHFLPTLLPYQTLARMWETEALIAKAIEAPGHEVFREGFEIAVPDDTKYDGFKEDLEEELLKLGVEDRLERAYQFKRAYGGGAVLLGINDGRPLWEPLDETRKDLTLDYLETYEPLELTPYELYLDPNLPNYGAVATYRLAATAGYGPTPGSSSGSRKAPPLDTTTVIHQSRLIVFNGVEVSRYWRSTNLISPYWGTSVVPRFYETIRDLDVAMAGLGLLMTDAGQPVIAMNGLKEAVARNATLVRDRFHALNMSRSIARAIVIDAEKEKFERQTTNLAGMAEIIDRLCQYGAAEVDIPLSILIGYSPATLGKADSNEMTLWFNQTRKRQRREFSPPLRRIIKYVIPKLRKYKVPDRWGIHWLPLERMTLKETIEARKLQSQIDSIDIKSGMITSDEARKSRYTASGYSYETRVPHDEEAPGFIAPLPAGVLPKADPAEKVVTSVEAEKSPATPASAKGGGGAKPATPGLTAHAVQPYVRRNPRSPAGGTKVSTATGKSARGDHADGHESVVVEPGGVTVSVPLNADSAVSSSGPSTIQSDSAVSSSGPSTIQSADVFLWDTVIKYTKLMTRNDSIEFVHLVDAFQRVTQSQRRARATLTYDRDREEMWKQEIGRLTEEIQGAHHARQCGAGCPYHSRSDMTSLEEAHELHDCDPDTCEFCAREREDAGAAAGGGGAFAGLVGGGVSLSRKPIDRGIKQLSRQRKNINQLKSDDVADPIEYAKGDDIADPDEYARGDDVADPDESSTEPTAAAGAYPGGVPSIKPEGAFPAEPEGETPSSTNAPDMGTAKERTGSGARKEPNLDPQWKNPAPGMDGTTREPSYSGWLEHSTGTCDPTDCPYHDAEKEQAQSYEGAVPTMDALEHSDFITQRGGKWVVLSQDKSKQLGSYATKGEAVQRLHQVEWFKKHGDALRGVRPGWFAIGANQDEVILPTFRFGPLTICIENDVGTTREWTDTDGTEGSTTMTMPYGFIDGALGVDGDFVDCYVGPDANSDTVYVVHQMSKATNFGSYDEDKVMLGQPSADTAKAAYLRQYNDPRFFGSMSSMPMDAFVRNLVRNPSATLTNNVEENS